MPSSLVAKAGVGYSGAQTNISVTQESVDYHWGIMPTGTKDFILNPNRLDENSGFISIRELAAYWSAPGRKSHAVSDAASSLCGASLYLALIYIRMRRYGEARALVINACFLHQCFIRSTPIEYIQGLCSELSDDSEILAQLPQCLEGFYAAETPQKMERYAKKYLPPEYRQLMTSIGNLSDKRHIMNYVGQSKFYYLRTIPDYCRKQYSSNHFHFLDVATLPVGEEFSPSSSMRNANVRDSPAQGEKIIIVIVDSFMDGEPRRCRLEVARRAPLKSLFTRYAEDRGLSLRSLRFVYKGKTLFLSSVGKMSPDDMKMSHQDEIVAHDSSVATSRETNPPKKTMSKQQQRNSKSKKTRGATKSKTKSSNRRPAPKSSEPDPAQLKFLHSESLTLVHEEAEPRLKLIRQRLNNLSLQRTRPKVRSSDTKSHPFKGPSFIDNPCSHGCGGKAGKAYFHIHVGAVENLYKTRSLSCGSLHGSNMITADLHGMTSNEALSYLDERLGEWIDMAMRGDYPWVLPGMVVFQLFGHGNLESCPNVAIHHWQ